MWGNFSDQNFSDQNNVFNNPFYTSGHLEKS